MLFNLMFIPKTASAIRQNTRQRNVASQVSLYCFNDSKMF